MSRKCIPAVLALLYLVPAGAQSFQARLEQGHEALASGDPGKALAIYRDLQVDDPESDVLYYNIGCAKYEEAMDHLALEAVEDARHALEEAREAFAQVRTSPDQDLRRNGGYNQANAIAQIAKQTVVAGDHDNAVEAFRESVETYESFLERYPDHEAARHNLEHMRYFLKNMLQNPPPPQEQEQQQEQEQEQQQEQEQDDQQEQEPQDDQQQQQEQQQDESGEDQPEEDDQQEQEPPPSEGEEQEQQHDQQQQDSEEEPSEEMRNVEALLESLEEQDKEEQRRRMHKPSRRVDKNWW